MKPRTWRTEKRTKARGTYWLLISGRNEERAFVTLGYVSTEEAERARATLQAEEAAGTASRVLGWFETDAVAAVRYLLGDPGVLALLPPPKPDYPRMALREYHEKVYVPHRKVDRPRTWRNEAGHWRRVLEAFGDVRLRDVEPRIIYRWVRDVRVAPRRERHAEPDGDGLIPAGGNYQRLMRNALQALLTHAYVEGHVEEHVRLGTIRLRGSTTATWARPDPLNLEELAALLKASDPKHRALFAVAAGQGLRPSELCRLTWERVRWADQLLDVPGLKTHASAATIPFTPIALRELKVFWVAKGQPKEGLVFPGPRGKVLKSYKRALDTAAEKAGIERSVFPYLLRASFATIAWSLGIDKDTARRVLRHADMKMLDEVYTRPRPAELVTRVAAFDFGA